MKPVVWTREREALLKSLYVGGERLADILPRLNALPGTPIASPAAVSSHAQSMELFRAAPPEYGANHEVAEAPLVPLEGRERGMRFYPRPLALAIARGMGFTADPPDWRVVNDARIAAGEPIIVVARDPESTSKRKCG